MLLWEHKFYITADCFNVHFLKYICYEMSFVWHGFQNYVMNVAYFLHLDKITPIISFWRIRRLYSEFSNQMTGKRKCYADKKKYKNKNTSTPNIVNWKLFRCKLSLSSKIAYQPDNLWINIRYVHRKCIPIKWIYIFILWSIW